MMCDYVAVVVIAVYEPRIVDKRVILNCSFSTIYITQVSHH